MYPDSSTYDYYLHFDHSNMTSEITSNLEYALTWLLNNLHNNIMFNCYIEIRKVIEDRDTHYIKEGLIFWENGFIVKKLTRNDTYKTIYSPYDLSLFSKTTLSHSYCELINKYNGKSENTTPTQQTPTQPTPTQQTQSIPLQSTQPVNNFKQINKLLDSTKDILGNHKKKEDQEVNTDTDTDNESVTSEQLHELEKNLDEMMNKQTGLQKNLDEEKDKLADIIMEENYAKTSKKKKEEKEKEKRNIFISDLSVYKKINKINSSVPDFFMAKCCVLDYLDKNNFFDGEDLENPSNELFEVYNILYNSRFTKDYVPPEDFEGLVMDFIDSLPEVDIVTQEQLHAQLNKISEYGMFSTDLVRN